VGYREPAKEIVDGKIDLSPWGSLRLEARDRLVLQKAGYSAAEVDPGPLFSKSTWLLCFPNLEEGFALLGEYMGPVVSRVDLTAQSLEPKAELKRHRDSGLRYLTFRAAGARALAVYENGLVCFDSQGEKLWQLEHMYLSTRLASIDRDVVWLQDETIGRAWGYDLDSGRPIAERGLLRY